MSLPAYLGALEDLARLGPAGEIWDAHREAAEGFFAAAVGSQLGRLPEGLSASLPDMAEAALAGAYAGQGARLAIMPGGVFGQDLARGLARRGWNVTGFLDNHAWKKGSHAGELPVLPPNRLDELGADAVLCASPRLDLQALFHKQLSELRPKPGPRIVELGNVGQWHRLSRDLRQRQDEAEAFAREAASSLTGSREPIILAVRQLTPHYRPFLRSLGEHGHPVVLATLTETLPHGHALSGLAQLFSAVRAVDYDYLDYLLTIQALARALPMARLWTSDSFADKFHALIARGLWPGLFFHEIYDLADNAHTERQFLGASVQKTHGFDLMPLEDAARAALYPRCNGIIYRDSPRLLAQVFARLSVHVPALQFPAFFDAGLGGRGQPTDGRATGNEEPQLVFCGHMPSFREPDPELERAFYPYSSFPALSRCLSDQGFGVHFYNPHDPDGTAFPALAREAAANPRVRLHRPLPVEELQAVLPGYDFGMLFFYFLPDDPRLSRYATTFSTRFLNYVLAGLPSICSEESAYLAELIHRHQVGLVVSQDDIPNLGRLVAACDLERLRARTAELRQRWDIRAQIPRLSAFLSGLAPSPDLGA